MKDLSNAVLQIFKSKAPKGKTRRLVGQVRVEMKENGFDIISDIYYMPYTTEKWGYHSGWKKTLINPHEGWWQEAFEMSIRFVSSVLGKEFVREQ